MIFALQVIFFFFNDTATTEIYTLSLHDALPTSPAWRAPRRSRCWPSSPERRGVSNGAARRARSEEHTLNSSHGYISYAVFCLKKKKKPNLRSSYKTNKKKTTAKR